MTPAPLTAPTLDDLLGPLTTVDADTRDRLHARLEAAAGRAGVLDVAYRTVDSPVGPILVAATEAGLIRVAFDGQDHAGVLSTLAEQVSPRILRSPARLEAAARELDEYFAGRRATFDLPLDLRLAHGLRLAVLSQLRRIGYGRTASYGEVAAAAGHPRAARAIGSACRTNPLPIVVPCHRVVRADGSPGEYVGGAAAKRLLLALETSP